MPDQGRHNLYDLEQLKLLLEDGYTVLTPNFRMARSISSAWNQAQVDNGHRTWHSVSVAALEAWLQGKWQDAVRAGLLEPRVLATQGQQSELWQEVIARHERDHKGYSLLRPTAAADQAGRARETLLRWQIDVNQPIHRQEFELDEDCATFFSWQTLFVEKLNGLGMNTPSDALVSLLGCAQALPGSKLVLVGFDEIPPLLRSCVQLLATDLQELDSLGRPGQCRAYEYPDKRSELAAIARWVRGLSDDSTQPVIGVILPNMQEDRLALEYLLRREFDCLGANYTSLPVNFSTGIPLDRVPMIRDALLMLSMERQRIAVADVVAVLQSRFHSMKDTDSEMAIKFIVRLFDAGTEFLDAGDLRYRATTIKVSLEDSEQQGLALGQILLAIAGMRDLRKRALSSIWADRFSSVLELWGWPGTGPLDSIEYQQLQTWYSLLDDFSAYDSVCGALSYEEALQLLCRCCARQVSQPETPDSNIHVLGLLEAAGLSFDHLWICDMQARNWPAVARPNPFIPIRMQRELAMPNATPEREWSFASALMSQYVCCAEEVKASYAQQRDGVPEKPSALLEGFEWHSADPVDIINGQWLALQKDAKIDTMQDNQAPPLDTPELATLAGGSGLLEDQSHCPFRAFARRRLKVSPLGEASVALSAADRGSLLHEALYHLWGAIGDSSTLAAMTDDKAASVIEEAVSAAIESLPTYKRGGMGADYFRLESLRLQSLLKEWLAVERQRPDFQVVAREERVSLTLGPLDIALRADRIDELPDGGRFIIDYKSGLSSPQDWLGERPVKPQLPLYGLAIQEPVAGLAFAQLRPRNCKYTGAGQTDVAPGVQSDIEKLVKEKMPVKDWEDLEAQWHSNLERLAREFVSGDSQVDPLNASSCSYCGLQAMCRVGEL